MANATPSRLGQFNAAGDVQALFLKVFSGEILTAFDRVSVFRPRSTVRVIPSGKSAQFPVTGLAQAAYHVPGTEITGQTIRAGERIITIDDLLLAPAFISNIDEAMNHYDVRSIYSDDIGQALAKTYDQNVARVGLLNARGTNILDDLQPGAVAIDAGYATDGTKLWQAVFNAGITLDTKDIPSQDRSAFFRPVQYALIVQSGNPINRDLNGWTRDNGSIAQGNVDMVNSIEIVKTNNLPGADDTNNLDIPASRRANYSNTYGLIQHKSAVGTVQLQDVTMESAYDIRRQGTLMVGKYLVGHGSLRPESGVELRIA
ncbi:hypothetical protein [Novosphingobium sp.]|uniref:hypothetical protein n=1 Tax=Novosphingobium sp. TaxID=1874826 RepID=UPI003B51FEC6